MTTTTEPHQGHAYEAHVTVAARDRETVARFGETCRSLGIKPILIELPEGATPVQPMTATHHRGPFETALAEARSVAARLAEAGFEVVRVKVEALGRSPEAPETDAEAALRPDLYFELHGVVALAPGDDGRALASLVARYGARLSTNALKGGARRYLTQRVYGAGRATAEARFEALLAAARGAGYPLSRVRRELTVYDSNLALDAGWVPMPGEEVAHDDP